MKAPQILLAILIAFNCSSCSRQKTEPKSQQSALQEKILHGWNTWNNPNLLSFVKMPEGLSLRVTFRNKCGGPYWCDQAYISGPQSNFMEKITPIAHAYDGSYVEMNLEWAGLKANIKAAVEGDDIFIFIRPDSLPSNPPFQVLEAGILWNKSEARITNQIDHIEAQLTSGKMIIRGTSQPLDTYFPLPAAYLTFSSAKENAIYTGKQRSLEEIKKIIEKGKNRFLSDKDRYNELGEAYEAMQAVLSWNLIYDAQNKRAITSVSRVWNEAWGGYIIFDWDTYFAALMLSLDQKELAYSNVFAITRSITERGFVPNVDASNGIKSFDRSQPPVGSMVCKLIYDKYQEKWFLEQVYQNLLTWNRWWDKNRNNQGFLSWGSDSHPMGMDHPNTKQAAMLESGLDNSPLFEDAAFNSKTHTLELADAGLMGLYVADCNYLAEIAAIVGNAKEVKELKERSAQYGKKLMQLWDDKSGIFRDKYTDRNEFSKHLAPTNFYPLIAGVATQQQAERMIKNYFFNPKEFYGEFMIPSISRNDAAFTDNEYWRGRIWAPMNFLVYMGLRNYDLPEAKKAMVDKSLKLIMKEWRQNRHVYENYNAVTGFGGDVRSSDAFYSWGGLLSFIAIMDKGYYYPADSKK
jgi:putative isomerase